jgi:hypothetical protein
VNSVGFTASRDLSGEDIQTLVDRLDLLLLVNMSSGLWTPETRFITGGCRDGDAIIAEWLYRRGMPVHTILPADHKQIDFLWARHANTYYQMPPGTTYKDRNAAIVAESERVYGFPMYPETHPRSRRSGTWQTIRMARRAGKFDVDSCLQVLRLTDPAAFGTMSPTPLSPVERN